MYKKQFQFLKKLSAECETDHGPLDLSKFTIRGRGLPFFSFYPPHSVVYKPVFFDEPTFHPSLVLYWKHRKQDTFFVNLVKIDEHENGLIYFDEPIHQIKNNNNQNINISSGFKLINIDLIINNQEIRRKLSFEINKVIDNIEFDNRMCVEDDYIVAPVNYDGDGTLLYSEIDENIYCFDVLAPRRLKKNQLFMGWSIVERDEKYLKIIFLTDVTDKEIQECIEYNIAEQKTAHEKFKESSVEIEYSDIEIYNKEGEQISWRCVDSNKIHDYQVKLYKHPLIRGNTIDSIQKLRTFMETHVYAVWDFMSLLKYLQGRICPTSTPWVPNKYTTNGIARLINEIVLAEESDVNIDGQYMSHFEIYVLAMKEIGADTKPIMNFVRLVREVGIEKALDWLGQENDVAARFVGKTMELIKKNSLSGVASAFTYGRETSIPAMFGGIVENLHLKKEECPMFYYYMNRHIELDGDEHGPASLLLVNILTDFKETEIKNVEKTAFEAINERLLFWDGLYDKF